MFNKHDSVYKVRTKELPWILAIFGEHNYSYQYCKQWKGMRAAIEEMAPSIFKEKCVTF